MSYLSQVREQLLSTDSKLSIIEDDYTYTAGELKQKIEAYIALVASWNLPNGSRVAIIPQRTTNWITFMYALIFLGHPPLLLDAKMDDKTLEKVLTIEALIFGSDDKQVGSRSVQKLPVVNVSDANNGLLESLRFNQDTKLFTAHTSGTTGTPKKISYSNGNIDWAVNEYERIYDFRNKTTILFSLPYHYCYSVIPCVIVPFALGKSIVIASEESWAIDIAQLIQKQHIEILVVNPVFYSELSRMDLSQFDFSSLRICDSGGESIPLAVVRRLKSQTDVLITEGYGLTETTSLTHFLLPDSNGQLRLGSVGQASVGVEARIVQPDGEEVQHGEIGELQIKGPMVAPYDHDTSETQTEWFETGDLFYEDEDGFFYFVSRKKDVPDIEPSKVLAVSQLVMGLLEDTAIRDVSYIFNEQGSVVLFMVTDFKDEERDERTASIIASFPIDMQESLEVRYVAALPRTSTGKVRKKDL